MSGAATTHQPSEDVCELPEAMRRLIIPLRGGASEPLTLDLHAAEYHAALLREKSERIEVILVHSLSEPDLVQEFRALDNDLAAATPLAAGLAAAVVTSQGMPGYKNPAGIVDAWIATRGLPFAVRAAVEFFGVCVERDYYSTVPGRLVHRRGGHEEMVESQRRFDIAVRLRRHLVSASEEDYAQVREVLASERAARADPSLAESFSRLLTSFLMPERTDWVDADLPFSGRGLRQDRVSPWLTLSSLTTRQQAEAFPTEKVDAWGAVNGPAALWTAFANVDIHLLPVVTGWLGLGTDADTLLAIVAATPSDDAFRFLVDNIDKKHYVAATQRAAKRFPRRALRLLAEAALRDTPRGQIAATVLRRCVVADDDFVRAEAVNLAPAARGVVEKIRAANVRVPEAATEALPPLLVSPPWLTAAKPVKPAVITGLVAPAESGGVVWRDGEQERWASVRVENSPRWSIGGWDEIAQRITRYGTARWDANGPFAMHAPEELVRPLLPVWRPDGYEAEKWARGLAARFGAEALPPVLHLARKEPKNCAAILVPFASPEAAPLAADWLSRPKLARPHALAWLTRHPSLAARTLMPVAVGKAGKARNAAELALRALAGRGFTAEIEEAAAGYGEAVAKAVAAIIADDGTLALPKVMPAIPDWADPRMLPQVLLKDRQTALPEASKEYLLLMLAVSKPAEPYAGLQIAQDICDPTSLAEFAWAVFESWCGVECPPKEGWAFDALRWFGDDETVRRLTPLIRQWPGESGHQRAVLGLDVLADIGGDVALMHLHGISQKVKFKGLKDRAVQRVTEIADDLGLTADQLGDRLVPDLGLDPDGTLTLDYGPRQFPVGFDEQLKPFVAEQDGKRLKALPKPGPKDDDELAPAAYQRFSALKKDVRTLAASQITRFELAMVTQRRWTVQEFGEYFIAHPLLRHLVRRLVWATFTEGGIASTFRVAEDLTLADISDNEYTLADDAVIGIAHPLDLGSIGGVGATGGDSGSSGGQGNGVAAWSDVFADYEILQPFAQLGRTVHALTDEEKTAGVLTRFDAIDVPTGKILGLERRGWRRGVPEDAGVQNWIYRTLPGGGSVTVTLDPGIPVGYVNELGENQRFPEVFMSTHDDGEDYWARRDYPAFAGLDPVTASELLRDLTEATTR